MAIRVPTTDYSPLVNAKQNSFSAKAQAYSTKNQELQSESITQQKQNNKTNLAIQLSGIAVDAVSKGVDIYNKFKDINEASQLEKAKGSVLDASTEYQKMIFDSQLNGTTKVVENTDGSLAIQVDQSIVDWQNNQLKAIDESSDMKSVKDWKKQNLQTVFNNGQSQLMQNAAKIGLDSFGQTYSANLNTALVSDIKSGSYANGVALISSRSDLSQIQKTAQFTSYKHSVDSGVAQSKISSIAAASGLGPATEAAYALDGFSIEEIQGFVSTAANTDKQLTASAITNATTFMQSGLDSGKAPAVLWQKLNASLVDVPEDRKQAALDGAKKTQISWATDKTTSLWNTDRNADLATLASQRKSIEGGSLSISTFQGVPEVKKAALALYDKRIEELEKAGTTANTKAQSDSVKANKTVMDGLFESLKGGTISGSEAITAMNGLYGDTDSYEDDLYAKSLINKIKDDIVPESFKPTATKFLSEMENLHYGIPMAKDGKLTIDQTSQISQARLWANQSIANLFMETPSGNISNQQFSEALASIKQTFVSKNLDALESGNIVDRFGADPIDDAITKNQEFGSLPTSPVIMDQNGQIQWANSNLQKTYDAIAGQFNDELKKQFSISTTSAPSPLMIQGKPYPTPIIQGITKEGTKQWFAIDKDQVFSSPDGIEWKEFGTLKTKTKFKEQTAVNQFFDQFRNTQGSISGKPQNNSSSHRYL